MKKEYSGNAIYGYISNENLDYYYSTKNNWMLVYGDSNSIPKIIVFLSRVNDINCEFSEIEKQKMKKALSIAQYLRLHFVIVRFMQNNNSVKFWEEGKKNWDVINYDQLRAIYEKYGVVQPGITQKNVNQYVSSSYHDWQRNNLGKITVSDFDLIKYSNNQVQEIVELKRSEISLKEWEPFKQDYPNFALLINSIIGSGKKIPFTLYYNFSKQTQNKQREDDISLIKVFDFTIPQNMILSNQVKFCFRDCYKLDQLLK